MKSNGFGFTRRCSSYQVLPLAVLLLASAGCVSTFKEVKPLANGPPPAVRPSTLALGEIKVTDARLSDSEKSTMAHAFQLGVEKWCAAHTAFTFVAWSSATNTAPPESVVLTGTIHEVEKGSAAARFWVGMGAGQSRVQGEFALDSPEGKTLTRLTARKSYLGGTGIGGSDMLPVDGLVSQLGELVAESTDKWLRGEKLD
jgi:hypothetical protein